MSLRLIISALHLWSSFSCSILQQGPHLMVSRDHVKFLAYILSSQQPGQKASLTVPNNTPKELKNRIDLGHLPNQKSMTVTKGMGCPDWPCLGHMPTPRAWWSQTTWESDSQTTCTERGRSSLPRKKRLLVPKDREMNARQAKAASM